MTKKQRTGNYRFCEMTAVTPQQVQLIRHFTKPLERYLQA